MFLARRGGAPPPWTDDPVLGAFRFCNIFREDDRVTIWFRENIRQPLSEQPKVLAATMAFRWFNRIETGELLKPVLLAEGWNSEAAGRILRAAPPPYFTGAFMVRSEPGRTKLDGVLEYLDAAAPRLPEFLAAKHQTLQAAHAWLKNEIFGLGPFLAYEIVTDLRHTALLRDATDIHTWASAGPGAHRGLARLLFGTVDRRQELGSIGVSSAQARMNAMMRELLEQSKDTRHWPVEWPAWEMRDVEHTLCEYDKYKRGYEGGKLKRRFVPQ